LSCKNLLETFIVEVVVVVGVKAAAAVIVVSATNSRYDCEERSY
jgi:hypothetical protein